MGDSRNGEVYVFFIYDCPDEPLVGHEYLVAFNAAGNSQRKAFTVRMECVKSEEGRAWFIDRQSDNGLVMAL